MCRNSHFEGKLPLWGERERERERERKRERERRKISLSAQLKSFEKNCLR
jgi:hypothetical protein